MTSDSDNRDSLPRALDCLNYVQDENNRGILKARLWGQNCAEIGAQIGKTRETVRMKCYRSLKQARREILSATDAGEMYEDIFFYIYKNYDMTPADIAVQFKEPVSTKAYIDIMRCSEVRPPISGRKPAQQLLYDNKIPIPFRKILLNAMNDNTYVFIGGERVPRVKRSVVIACLKGIAPESVSLDELIAMAKTAMITGGAKATDSFVQNFDIHWQNVDRINGVLACGHQCVRYYDFSDVDPVEVYKDLNISKYDGLVISSEKLIQDDPSILKRYKLNNETELHNFMRHLFDGKDLEFGLRFGRTPIVEVGDCDRDRQFRDLIRASGVTNRCDFQEKCKAAFGLGVGSVQAYAYLYESEGVLMKRRRRSVRQEGWE